MGICVLNILTCGLYGMIKSRRLAREDLQLPLDDPRDGGAMIGHPSGAVGAAPTTAPATEPAATSPTARADTFCALVAPPLAKDDQSPPPPRYDEERDGWRGVLPADKI